jgi:CheY-like chemotaxis protein
MHDTKTLHILHIEDDECDAELIWRMLDKFGIDYRVTLAMTRDAYQKALREGGVDLVLSDSRGYDFDGEEALRFVRANYAGIPFLFLSGSYEKRDPHVLMAEGATQCLLKDHLHDLGSAISRATLHA